MGRGRSKLSGQTIKNSQGKEVPLYNTMPKGWVVDRQAQTAPLGYVWIHNNKSRFSGQRKSGLILQSKVK